MTQSQTNTPPTGVSTKITNATDDFITERLPSWLTGASPEQVNAVIECWREHTASQDELHKVSAGILPPDTYALNRLQSLMQVLKVKEALGTLYWRDLRRSFRVPGGVSLPEDTIRYIHQPALQRLMQNFKPDANFYLGSGLSTSDKDPVTTSSPTDLVSDQVYAIALFCREQDIGQDYQDHLDKMLDQKMQVTLTLDKRKGLALAAEVAAIKGEVSQAELQMLRQLVADGSPSYTHALDWHVLLFKLLDCRVDGALAFEQRDASGQVQRVLLYLPDAPRRSLYSFSSWSQLNDTLATELRKKDSDAYLRRRIGLKQLPGFLNTLSKRLSDPSPDLDAAGEVPASDAFASLAEQQVSRIKADARQILVPTDDADDAASELRLKEMKNVGLVLLNVAGLFVPVVGELLLAQTVVHLLSETFEGVRDWSLGHQHEAIEHLLGVAETIAVGAVVAAGGAAVSRGFTRSDFVDGLVPIHNDADAKRLWSEDLGPYAAQDMPEQTEVLDNGLHTDGQRHWWRRDNTDYEVRQDQGSWRLQHPHRPGEYAPRLRFNGERSWLLNYEHAFEWQGSALLLSRLWPQAASLDAQRVEQILQVASVDDNELRALLVENCSLPVSLRDTLERFSIDARIETFFANLSQVSTDVSDSEFYSWCLAQVDIADLSKAEQRNEVLEQADRLRVELFEHFSRQYLPADDGLALIQRDFTGLPDAYAIHLLEQASDADRLRMTTEKRIPLALAEQARSLVRLAKLTRMREGLFLRNSYQSDSVDLAFNLLRDKARWPESLNLELREGSDSGRRLAVMYPQSKDATVMVRKAGRFWLYDSKGYELDLEIEEPAGLPEVLLAILPDADRKRLHWTGTAASEQVLSDLQSWLPTDRQQLEQLVGWRKIKPWFNPGQRLADGRVGYLLSGRGSGRHPTESLLRARIRALYLGFNEEQVDRFLEILLQTPGSAFDNLLDQELEYRQLDAALATWQGNNSQSSILRARRIAAQELRRCWRLQGEQVIDSQGQSQGMRLSLIGSTLQTLPELPARANFNHVTELALVNLQLRELPARFLQNFRDVRWLSLSNNRLTTLPEGVERLTQLRTLQLHHNRIRMTEADANALSRVTQLRTLTLSDNPLGAINLTIRQPSLMSHLSLRNCQLHSVPSGLVWCAFLERADLRGNQISSVPEEILQAPYGIRRVVMLEGNALSAATMARLYAPDPVIARSSSPSSQLARETWTESEDPQEQQQRGTVWDQVQAEPESQDFFQLLSELSGTSDFRQARADLERRVWEVLDAAQENSELRQELFSLAANPRTCVDSVASCFSALEVRVFAARALQSRAPEQARAARLDVARRLFRLDRVEQIAREDIESRRAQGRGVDEIEVSLAYRSGLARELNLPGQPATMQFQAVAGVSNEMLADAAQSVREAENSDALAEYISQRDFWLEYLRSTYAERFSAVEQPFWDRLEALDDGEGISEGAYLEQANQIASEREQAFKALALELTSEALAAERAGEGGS